MRFVVDEATAELAKGARVVLERACPPTLVRSLFSSESGRDPALYSTLAENGFLGVMAPESLGGLGMDAPALVGVVEEAGRVALPAPLVETAVAVEMLIRAAPEVAASVVPSILDGSQRIAVHVFGEHLVADAHTADLLLLPSGDELHLVSAGGTSALRLQRQESVDGARRLYDVGFRPAAATRIASGDVAARAQLRGESLYRLLVGAELLGLSARMLEMTVLHVQTRQQFGQAVGAFQAVKHHLTDALLRLDFARPMVLYAAAVYARPDKSDAEAHVAAMKAKLYASDAGRTVARKALQCHGAMGYSFEYDLQLWMKRAWARALSAGTVEALVEGLADELYSDEHDETGEL